MLLLVANLGFGQVIIDDFEDGNLTGWGQGSAFSWANSTTNPITGNRSLKHNISGSAGSSYIAYNTSALDLNNQDTNWQFNLSNGNWDPSGANKFWVYLTANEFNLNSNNVDGYVIGVNLTGTSDILTLWKVTNGSADGSIISSSINWDGNDTVGIKVTRSLNGEWELFVDTDGGFDNLISEGTGINTDYTFNNFFGLSFTYTSTRAGLLWMDDLLVENISGNMNNNDTEIFAATPQISNSTIVASNSITIADDAEVFGFVIEDQASGDALPTNVTKMRFTPGANNTALWPTTIEGITLYDENLVDYSPTVTITDTDITLDFDTPITVANGSSLEFVLGFYLKENDIVDNSIIQFEISDTTNGFEANASGSTFINPLTLGTITGPETTINVVASDLIFAQQPSNSEINIAINPAVIVDAVDINGNKDIDYTGQIDLTVNDLSFSNSATTSVNAINGSSLFDNLLINTSGVGTLTANATGLNNSNLSNAFGVAPNRSSIWCETFTDNSLYNVTLGAEGNNGSTDYFQITDGSNINIAYTGNNGNFFAAQDIDAVNGGSNPSQLIWSGINIEGFTGIRFTGKFASAATESIDNADEILVEYRTNGSEPWISFLAFNNVEGFNTFFQEDTDFDGVGDGIQLTSTFQKFSKLLFTTATDTSLDLRLTVSVNSGNEDIAFEDFKIEGIGGTYPGNTATGFDGPLGTGSFEIDASSGSNINFTFNRGVGGNLGLFENHIVVYIDSQPGGISSTANLTDTGDDGRKAVSGFSGISRSTVNFPPGFEPDYAISLNNNFAGLFEIVENGSHNFVQSASLSPSGENNAESYAFNIDFSNINAIAGGESFKFLATYLNANTAFRSDESIGDNTATESPGTTPIDFITYYQATSRKKGGLAPSSNDGLWTTNETWVNGNAPLEGDEVIINNTVSLNTDFTTNNIDITTTGIFTVNADSNFEITGGVSGNGSFNVDGNLIIADGGFTNLVPNYGIGSSLIYMDVIDTYNRFNEWTDGSLVGSGVPDNVIIDNTILDLTNTSQPGLVNFNIGTNLSIFSSGSLTIDPAESLTLGGDLTNIGGSLDLNSVSDNYSSLIVGGSSIGDVIYRRHINIFNNTTGSTTGQNDLIAAPVTNSSQTFEVFAAANTNIPTGNINGVPSFLFGPFDNDNNAYVNFNASNNGDVLTAGQGYRSASTTPAPNSTFTFVGDVETGSIPVPVNVGNASQWNLIGNPYPSYLSMSAFLTANSSAFNNSSSGIYGYDGDATDGFIVRNLGYFVLNSDEFIAPGQGFLVTSAPGGATVNFNPDMRIADTNGNSDDFIMGRQGITENAFITLEISKSDAMYTTDLYFLTDNVSLGLDPGFDTSVFGNEAPNDFAIFTHLIESNDGIDMAIQSLPSSSLSSVVVPLGVNVNAGEQFTISIKASSLPNTVDVFLEDTVNSTITLLNAGDYVLTTNVDIKDTGRYFLRFTDESLSTPSNNFDTLDVFVSKATKELVINGQVLDNTTVNIFDLQGRLVLASKLELNQIQNRIDVSNVSTGIYIVKLQNDLNKTSQKVVIE